MTSDEETELTDFLAQGGKSEEETSLIKCCAATEKDALNKKKRPFPKAVLFIIGNEFCERFSYYGMQAILTIFFTKKLKYSDDDGTMIFHIFAMACYFTPILGAVIADSWLGKYKTILYVSFIHAVGNIVLSVSTLSKNIESVKTLSLLGLGLIALGTGGIKPCVSAFGGDQFEPGQEKYQHHFFSFFYLAINFGSVISVFLTPVLREDVECFGDKCWPLAFGVPAILMIMSLIFFLFGKRMYKMSPPKENIIFAVICCMSHAISRKFKSKGIKRDHWLDYADDTYNAKFIEDIKNVLRVLLLYIPLPLFWALLTQQGSRWVLQGTKMDGRFFGYIIKPDQMHFFNPLLIIILVPVFEYSIYPALQKAHILVKPLQRMTCGGMLAATAFVVAGFLQLAIEKEYPAYLEGHMSKTQVINNSPCNVTISGIAASVMPYSDMMISDTLLGSKHLLMIEGCDQMEEPQVYDLVARYSLQTVLVTFDGNRYRFILVENPLIKEDFTDAKFSLFVDPKVERKTKYAHVFGLSSGKQKFTLRSISNESNVIEYLDVHPGLYRLYSQKENQSVDEMQLESGARYIAMIFLDPQNETAVKMKLFTAFLPKQIHILYQVPQYVIITLAEIMCSITGLEFSYSQAPSSMKSVVMSSWLLTVAFGSLFVVIVAKSKLFRKQYIEFFVFAVLMTVGMLVFAIIARFYNYVEPSLHQKQKKEKTEVDSEETH